MQSCDRHCLRSLRKEEEKEEDIRSVATQLNIDKPQFNCFVYGHSNIMSVMINSRDGLFAPQVLNSCNLLLSGVEGSWTLILPPPPPRGMEGNSRQILRFPCADC